MRSKLRSLKARYDELSALLGDTAVIADQKRYRELAREHAGLSDIAAACDRYEETLTGIEDCKAMLSEQQDSEMRELIHAELAELEERETALVEEIRILLLPKDPNDDRNVIIEIRAGTGGDEAALFGADLLRMYERYAERHGFRTEFLNDNMTEMGGVKEVVLSLSGKGAYSRMKYESGVHRVQRVPETESGGRIHTSAATVAVLPEADDVEVEINPADLQIEAMKRSGAGGQHINKTLSAIRLIHKPSGIVIECQDERSQLRNKEKALRLLRARLYEEKQRSQNDQIASERKSQVGSGDRSGKIRTYNFREGRVTDHRIGLTVYTLDAVMNGNLDVLIDALTAADMEEKLKESDREA